MVCLIKLLLKLPSLLWSTAQFNNRIVERPMLVIFYQKYHIRVTFYQKYHSRGPILFYGIFGEHFAKFGHCYYGIFILGGGGGGRVKA